MSADPWLAALDESLLDPDAWQEWLSGHCQYQARVDLERLQRHIAVGRSIEQYTVPELMALVMVGDANEMLVARDALRRKWFEQQSESIAKIVWAYQDEPFHDACRDAAAKERTVFGSGT